MEAAGFENGYGIICGSMALISLVLGALIANCVFFGGETETQKARKALANVLNDRSTDQLPRRGRQSDDGMFDVPLNDAKSYVGPSMLLETSGEALTSSTGYVKAASKPCEKKRSNPSKYSNVTGVGNLTEEENYSFDVEL